MTPAVMAVFSGRSTSAAGAVRSILAGTVVTIEWQMVQQCGSVPSRIIFAWRGVYPALLASVGGLIVVGLLTNPSIREQFDKLAAH